jgi:hypothetical protein
MEACTVGVIADPTRGAIVREFFELFKIPWEFARPGQRYPVVLSDGNSNIDGLWAKLLIVFGGERTSFDMEHAIQVENLKKGATLSYEGNSLPIYGSGLSFPGVGAGILAEENTGGCAGYVGRFQERVFVRVGYDLFTETQLLLTEGQPPELANIPTLDTHIVFLRDQITRWGMPLVEIPPVPDEYSFIACLTHDIDHASIRRHKFDHTILGFLYRATLGSAINVVRGRLSLKKLFTNLKAAAKLPLVQLGLAKDFWYEFDRYTEIEKGRPSTFFVIPYEGNPGSTLHGRAPQARASAYGVTHVAEKVTKLKAAGCEIGLHGIDAWMNSCSGRNEAEEIIKFSGIQSIGVRMHWLYGNKESAAILEDGGFSYDSTFGYNETIGYRAGTSQAFRPQGSRSMLELPLIIMDTALFTSGRSNLSPKGAWGKVNAILDNAVIHGGALTINWHDRSIAPERLWGDFYISLLEKMEFRRPWFSTATQAISWFRKRREAVFEHVYLQGGRLHVRVRSDRDGTLPGLRLRYHRAQDPLRPPTSSGGELPKYVDASFDCGIELQMVH